MDGFVERAGRQLYVNGERFCFLGFNTYYLMVYAADEGLRHHVDEVFATAQEHDLRVCRTWAFNDGASQWMSLQPRPGELAEHVLEGLDYVIERARQAGVRLILTLLNFWEDYGGMDQYVAWSRRAKTRADFYTDPECWEMFSAFVRQLIGRVNSLTGIPYADDPTIMAWELCNEPRARSDVRMLAGSKRTVLGSWLARAGALVKTLAPRQIVMTGVEGFWRPRSRYHNPPRWVLGEGTDFIELHRDPTFDVATFHTYPDHWWMPDWMTRRWIEHHLEASRSPLEMPVILGEFGRRGVSREADFEGWLELLLADARQPGTAFAGALFWSLYHDEYEDYDRFGVYLSRGGAVSQLIGRYAREFASLR